jgi:hypothetical protein
MIYTEFGLHDTQTSFQQMAVHLKNFSEPQAEQEPKVFLRKIVHLSHVR